MKRVRESGFRIGVNYIRDSHLYIWLVVALFIISGVFAFFAPDNFSFFDSIIQDLANRTEGLNASQLVFFIFQNNVLSAFMALLLGIFAGIVPFGNSLMNGALIGYVIAFVAPHVGALQVIARLLPHGIFELPAIFISLGLGIKLGWGFFVEHERFYRRERGRLQFFSILFVITLLALLVFLSSAVTISFAPEAGSVASVAVSFFAGALIFLGGVAWTMVLLFGNPKLRRLQWKSFGERFSKSMRAFFYVVLPLLIIAAVIEGLLIAYF